MSKIIQHIREDLKAKSDTETRTSGKRFFKEDINLYGIKTAEVEKMAKVYFISIKDEPKKKIFGYCEELWKSGFMEESFIACNWSYALRNKFEPADFNLFERWLSSYVRNWAACDTLCNHTIATFIEMYPNYINELKKWAKSDNRWMRRGAAVTLIIPARNGKFLDDVFEIADILLLDSDDLVQKGYGWMLKAASNDNQQKVFNYVMQHKTNMPRTALRYAIEKMPDTLRSQAMAKEKNV